MYMSRVHLPHSTPEPFSQTQHTKGVGRILVKMKCPLKPAFDSVSEEVFPFPAGCSVRTTPRKGSAVQASVALKSVAKSRLVPASRREVPKGTEKHTRSLRGISTFCLTMLRSVMTRTPQLPRAPVSSRCPDTCPVTARTPTCLTQCTETHPVIFCM